MFTLLIATSVISCGRFSNETSETSTSTKRYVCLSKQYTEMLYALGAEEHLTAVDYSSTYPPQTSDLTTVGYHRALSAEAVLAVEPTLILHNNNIGPEHVVTQLEELQIPMKVFSEKGNTWESAKLLLKEMGQWAGYSSRADSLVNAMDVALNQALENSSKYPDTPTVMVIHYGRATNTYLVMTSNSTGAKMIEWAGGKVPFLGDRGMRPLSAEVIAEVNPEVIIMTNFGYDRLPNYDAILQLPGVRGTRAAENKRIYRFEEHDLVYLGPRTGENVLKLQEMLHAKP